MEDKNLLTNPYFVLKQHFGSAYSPLIKFVFLQITQIGFGLFYLVQYVIMSMITIFVPVIMNSSDIDLK